MAEITIPEGATIQESTRKAYSVGGVSTTVFPLPFPFFNTSDIVVYVDGVLKTETTDYVITGTAVTGGFSSGTCTLNTGVTNVVVIVSRKTPIERLTDFSASGPFPMAQLNLILDKLYAIQQQQRTTVVRAVRLDDNDETEDMVLPDATTRALNYLYFDATGTASVAQNLSTGAAVISAFMTTVLDDNDALTARTTLGLGRYATIHVAGATAIPTGVPTALIFDTEVDDVGDWWAVGTPTRVTVPAGVTKIQIHANISLESVGTGTYRKMLLHKNGGGALFFGNMVINDVPNAGLIDHVLSGSSAILTVTPGDYFELVIQHDKGSNLAVNNYVQGLTSWLTVEAKG